MTRFEAHEDAERKEWYVNAYRKDESGAHRRETIAAGLTRWEAYSFVDSIDHITRRLVEINEKFSQFLAKAISL